MAKGERKRALRGRAGRMKGGRGSGRASARQVRLWGRHAVEAALKNPERVHCKLALPVVMKVVKFSVQTLISTTKALVSA